MVGIETFGIGIFCAYISVAAWAFAAIMWHFFVRWLAARLIAHSRTRPPDLVIGINPSYLSRWELWRPFGIQVALHKITRSDDDRAPHDHVSWHGSLILKNGYLEHIHGRIRWRRPGQIIFRKAQTLHRLELPVTNGGISYAWTLWIRGPKWREWGFMCGKRWVHWKVFDARGCE